MSGCRESCGGRKTKGGRVRGGVLRGTAPSGAEETDEMLPQPEEQTPGPRVNGLVGKCAAGHTIIHSHK